MLSSILTTLQSLISPSFVVADFFPMLAFWVMNGAMLYSLSQPFRTFLGRIGANGALQNSIWMLAFLVGTAMTAYMLSALIPKFQALMEGKWRWDTMVHWFAPAQGRRLEKLNDEIRDVARYRTRFDQTIERWCLRLQNAAEWGHTRYPGQNRFTPEHEAARAVQDLMKFGHGNRRLDFNQIENAVVLLDAALRSNDYLVPVGENRWYLTECFEKLTTLLETVRIRENHNHTRLQTERYFSFGTQNLAPTKMGNIANTIQSYAIDRYDMNLAVFWSRLQHSVANDKDFNAKLEAVRTKLEFLIGCSALTATWGTAWAIVTLVWGYEWIAFVCAAAGGPLIAYAWYRVATEHYNAYADVLRTSVDLFRFGLLKDLHLSLPADTDAERVLWDQLNGLTAYYEKNNLRFEHPKS